MFFLKKIFSFLKNYWYIPIFGGLTIVLAFLGKKDYNFDNLLDKTNKKHQKDLEAIETARQQKEKIKRDIENKRKLRMSQIETQYLREKKELTAENRKKIEKIIKKYNNNPQKIAKRLAKENGWKIILPDE